MRDPDIRSRIKVTLLKKFFLDGNSRVVDEMGVSYGEAVIDIAVINGHLHGYEIKSNCDNLNRLSVQLSIYSKTFDYLTIVAGEKHLDKVLEFAPHWCGVVVAYFDNQNEIGFRTVRKALKNRLTEKIHVARLLWKNETIEILNALSIYKGLNNKSKPLLWKLLADKLQEKQLNAYVREKLKARVNWKSDLQPSGNDDCSQLSSKL